MKKIPFSDPYNPLQPSPTLSSSLHAFGVARRHFLPSPTLSSSLRQTRTADLYIISVAL